MQQFFNISSSTARRCCEEGGEFLYSLLYKPDVTRKRIAPLQLERAKEFIETNTTEVSGRNWRLSSHTENYLYEKYKEEVEQPLNKTVFVYKLLHGYNIHHSTKPETCAYCAGTSAEKRKGSGEGLEHHK